MKITDVKWYGTMMTRCIVLIRNLKELRFLQRCPKKGSGFLRCGDMIVIK